MLKYSFHFPVSDSKIFQQVGVHWFYVWTGQRCTCAKQYMSAFLCWIEEIKTCKPSKTLVWVDKDKDN